MTPVTLPERVYFLCRHPDRWPELLQGECPDPEILPTRITSNEDCWVIHTYLRLKRLGADVVLTDRLPGGAICVVSGLDLAIRDLSFGTFIVACRSDGPYPALADFVVQQNTLQPGGPRIAAIPHWPQPGLIPRDPARGARIEVLAFKGSIVNLFPTFRSDAFKAELAALGVTLQVDDLVGATAPDWHDYRGVDVVLAVRNLTEADALTKPVSKLVNAWAAGVPALLGPEPAFRSVASAPEEYLEVTTPEDVLKHLRTLQEQPLRYMEMVERGRQRYREFAPDRIAQQWSDLLSGPVTQAYRRWRLSSTPMRLLRFGQRAVAHKASFREARYLREHGPRLLTG